MAEQEYLTVQEVADILRVHRSTVQRLASTGQLPGTLMIRTAHRKTWRIPRSALLALEALPEKGIQPIPKHPQLVANPFSELRRFCKKAL